MKLKITQSEILKLTHGDRPEFSGTTQSAVEIKGEFDQKNLRLDDSMVHIWHLVLPISENTVKKFEDELAIDEIIRANNFRYKEHQEQFICSRGGLRNILSHYLKTSPQKIKFQYTSYGKPYLENTDLAFNTSHSGKYIVYAITRKACIGVDVEEIKYDLDFLQLAKTTFSEAEYLNFIKLPVEDRAFAFYRLWTRKEAFLKAIGTGLHYPLDEVEVSFLPTETVKLVNIKFQPTEAQLWGIDEIVLDNNHVAAIATRQKYHNICLYRWEI
ncbi:MAG: 4'-phosphopantetheinyl transferase family protein [Candidatus Berkiellales bacterium]